MSEQMKDRFVPLPGSLYRAFMFAVLFVFGLNSAGLYMTQAHGADAAIEISQVQKDCQGKAYQFWKCSCLVEEFRKARLAGPDQNYYKLVDKVYGSVTCRDREKIRSFYLKKCPRENEFLKYFNTISRKKKPLFDCACYAEKMADKHMSGDIQLRTSKFISAELPVRKECAVQ